MYHVDASTRARAKSPTFNVVETCPSFNSPLFRGIILVCFHANPAEARVQCSWASRKRIKKSDSNTQPSNTPLSFVAARRLGQRRCLLGADAVAPEVQPGGGGNGLECLGQCRCPLSQCATMMPLIRNAGKELLDNHGASPTNGNCESRKDWLVQHEIL